MAAYVDRLSVFLSNLKDETEYAFDIIEDTLSLVTYEENTVGYDTAIYSNEYHEKMKEAWQIFDAIYNNTVVGGVDYTSDMLQMNTLNNVRNTDNPEVFRLSRVFRKFINDRYWSSLVIGSTMSGNIRSWKKSGLGGTVEFWDKFLPHFKSIFERFCDDSQELLDGASQIVEMQV